MNGNKLSKYSFACRLRTRRRDSGFTSCDKLADAIWPNEIGDSMRKKVERWETGKSEPSVSELQRLCDVLECDPEYLLGTCDTPRTMTKSVMEVTGLSQKAVEALSFFFSTSKTEVESPLASINVISLMLENPSFYHIARELVHGAEFAAFQHNEYLIQKAIQSDIGTQKYSSLYNEIQGARGDILEMKETMRKFGYTIIANEEQKNLLEFRLNKSISLLASETLEIICREMKEMVEVLFKEHL